MKHSASSLPRMLSKSLNTSTVPTFGSSTILVPEVQKNIVGVREKLNYCIFLQLALLVVFTSRESIHHRPGNCISKFLDLRVEPC